MTESGALLGLVLGVGLLLIWRSGSRAPLQRTEARLPDRRQQLLSAAGLTGINGAQLLAGFAGYSHFRRADRAIRRGESLPIDTVMTTLMTGAVFLAVVAGAASLFLG